MLHQTHMHKNVCPLDARHAASRTLLPGAALSALFFLSVTCHGESQDRLSVLARLELGSGKCLLPGGCVQKSHECRLNVDWQ